MFADVQYGSVFPLKRSVYADESVFFCFVLFFVHDCYFFFLVENNFFFNNNNKKKKSKPNRLNQNVPHTFAMIIMWKI